MVYNYAYSTHLHDCEKFLGCPWSLGFISYTEPSLIVRSSLVSSLKIPHRPVGMISSESIYSLL